jgi:chorismate mutase
MRVLAIRGATCLQLDDPAEMTEATQELLAAMLSRNAIGEDSVISILFTGTPDLHCAFPAAAARGIGFNNVPLMCAQEMEVPGALERVVRVMMHVEVDKVRSEIEHVFLRGAQVLRADLKQ